MHARVPYIGAEAHLTVNHMFMLRAMPHGRSVNSSNNARYHNLIRSIRRYENICRRIREDRSLFIGTYRELRNWRRERNWDDFHLVEERWRFYRTYIQLRDAAIRSSKITEFFLIQTPNRYQSLNDNDDAPIKNNIQKTVLFSSTFSVNFLSIIFYDEDEDDNWRNIIDSVEEALRNPQFRK
ncbi:11224_t:CDS:2 [Entrophospora sp. SA101]|nr:11224_t:CDS:2 [Entrophospora sp. SA101]